MKMRFFRDTLRFRLGKDAIAELAEHGQVRRELNVTASSKLVYLLRGSESAGEVRATLDAGAICVEVPRQILQQWACGRQVSLRGKQAAGEGRTLSILIEKDFECLDPRGNEPDERLYKNPRADSRRAEEKN